MIVITECRVDDFGKRLIIEAEVDNINFFKNVYISSLLIDTDETFSANGPSDNAVYSQEFSPSGTLICTTDCNKVYTEDEECTICTDESMYPKKVRVSLSADDLSLSSLNDNMFFVYLGVTGIPDPGTPCGMDRQYTIGVAVNLRPIYNKAMAYIKELGTCDIPKNFIDFILRGKAIELALKTGNFVVATKYWQKFFKKKIEVSINSGCGCDGS